MKLPRRLSLEAVGAAAPELFGNHAQRRREQQRQRRRERKESIQYVLKPEDVPAGSIMSEASLQAIAAGQFAMRIKLPPPAPTRRRRTYQDKLRERRIRNRQRSR